MNNMKDYYETTRLLRQTQQNELLKEDKKGEK